jgi:hypothetical protein
MKPYFYIYRVDHSLPRVKHATIESAHSEAMRLSEQHPGETFEILQCLGITRTTTPQTFWVDGVIPPHHCAMNLAMNGECSVCGKYHQI